MKILQTVLEAQNFSEALRIAGKKLALVPTMGALHEGHLTLAKEARKKADVVMVSIFVNPTQFGPNEDFDRYPRTLEADLAALASIGVDAVFTPAVSDMYPPYDRTWVTVSELDQHLCGASRPGHFRGVTTIVARLFLACRPQVAVFGLKDAQQFLIIRRMIRDLHFGIELLGVETVREPDGMAMSSRNRYLSETERKDAVVVSEAVFSARAMVLAGESDAKKIAAQMLEILQKVPYAVIQYAEVVETEGLQPVETIAPHQEVLCAVAVFFGKTRLIDNQMAQLGEG